MEKFLLFSEITDSELTGIGTKKAANESLQKNTVIQRSLEFENYLIMVYVMKLIIWIRWHLFHVAVYFTKSIGVEVLFVFGRLNKIICSAT